MPAGVVGLMLQADLLALATSSGHPATTEQWLSRLVLGGIQLQVVLQAATAEELVQQQQLLSRLELPESVSVISTQPRVLPVCLRSAAAGMALDSTTVAYAAQDTPAAHNACQSAGVHFFPDTSTQDRPQPLFRLMQQVANSHRQQSGAFIVGYTMKPSRERALAARGMLPLAPLHNVCFVPVDFAHPLDEQGPFDVILHKGTDELISSSPHEMPSFSARIGALAAFVRSHPETVMVDPIERVQQVVDRNVLNACLEQAAATARSQGLPVGTPASIQVDKGGIDQQICNHMTGSGIQLPCIVKPRVACGTPEAHHMALVLRNEGFQEMQVAMPGCLQQFINHNGLLYKVYVMGDQLHVTERQSIPNLSAAGSQDAGLPSLIEFDSLKSLPQRDYLQPHYESQQQLQGKGISQEVVHVVTAQLKAILGLTLFGYDVIVEEHSGVHYIIDVNYFPSYKEFPDVAGALAAVIQSVYKAKQTHRNV